MARERREEEEEEEEASPLVSSSSRSLPHQSEKAVPEKAEAVGSVTSGDDRGGRRRRVGGGGSAGRERPRVMRTPLREGSAVAPSCLHKPMRVSTAQEWCCPLARFACSMRQWTGRSSR